MRAALVVVTGVHPTAIDSAMVALAWDLPRAVSVRHRIDPHSQVLSRVVSDATGVLEREEVQLEHACISCALREDVLPTLDRLARDGRWSSIVLGLPTGAEAAQLTHALGTDPRLARRLRLSAVVAALESEHLVQDLLGDSLLRERDRHTGPDDERGTGEVAAAQVELADLVLLPTPGCPEGHDLLAALARPGAALVDGVDHLDAAAVVAGRHAHKAAARWTDHVLDGALPPLPGGSRAWRLDLSSPRPFHPERMLERIEQLGAGPFRSRGCFWLPTRPGTVQEWAGAGGQLSIGTRGAWGRRTPLTRLVLTGLDPAPRDLVAAFEDLLLTHEEALLERPRWRVLEDGLEPWLGDIRDVA